MMKRDTQAQERRGYIRMDTVLPVQFRLAGPAGVSGWIQGFTSDVSAGGMCLRINNVDPALAEQLRGGQMQLDIEIELPRLGGEAVNARASIVWFQESEKKGRRCFVGLRYESINDEENARIMRYARAKKMFLPAVTAVIVLLGAVLAFNSYINFRLVKGNKMLVGELIKVIQESGVAKERLKRINRETLGAQLRIQDLEKRIREISEEKVLLKTAMEQEKADAGKQLAEFNETIKELISERDMFQRQITASRSKETAVMQELERLDKEKFDLAEANFHKMVQWLAIHQNLRTGLIISFEGDTAIAGQAFMYDQALAALVFLYRGEMERARKVLEFFSSQAKRGKGLFFNAYFVNDGSPSEYVLHAGPNIWLGIAAAHYADKTKEKNYILFAETIAHAVMDLQAQDKEGGIRGGPAVSWFATEHNLDAYALFDMLHVLTGKVKYAEAREKVFQWLLLHSYDKPDIPVRRGKGDSTIATDTYAWSIAAIGPERLKQAGMDPDKIMQFAEEACAVTVVYARPDGRKVTVKGFDFAPQRHVSRGGVVSVEWTAQMVTSFKMMAEYHRDNGNADKAAAYFAKSEEYLGQLWKMIICRPSPAGQGEGCLPYASSDFVDSGNGWMTPKGKATGSVSGTAYTVFAYYGYNPLKFIDKSKMEARK